MMSQSDFLKNAGRWGGSDVATRHYRASVLSNRYYVEHNVTAGSASSTTPVAKQAGSSRPRAGHGRRKFFDLARLSKAPIAAECSATIIPSPRPPKWPS
jgi:hypothetical protein